MIGNFGFQGTEIEATRISSYRGIILEHKFWFVKIFGKEKALARGLNLQ